MERIYLDHHRIQFWALLNVKKKLGAPQKAREFLEGTRQYLLIHDTDDEFGHDSEAGVSDADQHVELRITRGLVSRVVLRHTAGCEKGNSPELDNATHWSCNINVHCLQSECYVYLTVCFMLSHSADFRLMFYTLNSLINL